MTASIKPSDLYRIIWNALLFTDKASPTGPVVEFKVEADVLTIRSADNYSGLVERWYLDSCTGLSGQKWYVYIGDLKDVSKKLRLEPDGEFDLLSLVDLETDCPHPGAWTEFDDIMSSARPSHKLTTFAVGHSRWKLLGRVRAGGDYPINVQLSVLPTYDDDGTEITPEVVEFKIGPDIRGYLAVLEDDVLEPEWRFR